MINGNCKLASPSTKQMVSNKSHKHERQVNQSRADYIKSVRSEVESGRKLVSFLQVWGADILHIKFMRPRQDVCANCEVMRHNIQGGDAVATT